MNSLVHLAAVYSDSDDEEKEEEESHLTSKTNENGGRQKLQNLEKSGMKRIRDEDDSACENPHSSSSLERTTRVKLEIPTGILDMFNPADIAPESSQHEGRVRSFDHFAGNWATHVLIPIDLPGHFSEFVSSLKRVWPHDAPELHVSDVSDVHVSISRTVPIRHHWISPLKEFLQRGFGGKRGFILDFPTISVYANDEKTRSFVALDVAVGILELKKLVTVVDKAFEEFGLPKYYEKPSFHASFSWCLGNIHEFLDSSVLEKMQALLDSYVEDYSSLVFTVREIQCQMGNKCFSFPLRMS